MEKSGLFVAGEYMVEIAIMHILNVLNWDFEKTPKSIQASLCMKLQLQWVMEVPSA